MNILSWLSYPEDEQLYLSYADFAEMYTEKNDRSDYDATFVITPVTEKTYKAADPLPSIRIHSFPDQQIKKRSAAVVCCRSF